VTVNVNTFVTNTNRLYDSIDGFIGVAPCPDAMKDYSLLHQLSLINEETCVVTNKSCVPDMLSPNSSDFKLEYKLNKSKDNNGLQAEIGGLLQIEFKDY